MEILVALDPFYNAEQLSSYNRLFNQVTTAFACFAHEHFSETVACTCALASGAARSGRREKMANIQQQSKERQEEPKQSYNHLVNKTLPYLVPNFVELLDMEPPEDEDDGAVLVLDNQRKDKCAAIKTSTRQAYFLPVIGLVDAEKLKPGDLVGVNKDSYSVLETLSAEYDARVKTMEADERPTEQYSDIDGLDKQIQDLIEAVVLPMTHRQVQDFGWDNICINM
uniref:Proteasomal ATPase second OB domain-containing protein n=1 Tax=Glossina pallidipes TaxID=7398 RepID=A0A1A9ZIZ9_GLOPL